MSLDLDALVDAIVVQSAIETGLPAPEAARLAGTGAGRRAAMTAIPAVHKHRRLEWQPEEDALLRRSLGVLSEAEIAQRLHRSRTAIHLRWERNLRLVAPSNRADVMTANQIAEGLGVDIHSIHRLITRSILPARRLPFDTLYRVVDRVTLLRWLVNPRHWIYFDPERAGARGPRRTKHKYDAAFWQKVRRLIELRQARWDDEWWTSGQVARYHGLVDSAAVNNAIHDGRLTAVRWGNWHILRSDALRTVFYTGKGHGRKRGIQFSDAADAFIVLARAVGLSWTAIDTLMKLPDAQNQAWNRLNRLHRESAIQALIRRHGLEVDYNRRTGALFADWKRYKRRFPGVARAMQRLRAGQALDYYDRLYICGVLRVWAEHAYRGRDRRRLLQALRFPHTRGEGSIREMLVRLRRAGVEPYKYPTEDIP